MADRILPGSDQSKPDGGIVWEKLLRHKHNCRPGRADVKCPNPGCGWKSGPWLLGCHECFQLSVGTYGAHLLARHMGDALELLARHGHPPQ